MNRVLPLFGLLTLAACTGAYAPGQNPLRWTQVYPQPWEAMTYCLNAQSTDYQTVLALDPRAGIGGVQLVTRAVGLAKTAPAGEFDVRRIDDRSSQVTFRSAIQTVGGSSAIEDWARRAADRCNQ